MAYPRCRATMQLPFGTCCSFPRRLPESPPSPCPGHVCGPPASHCSHDEVQAWQEGSIRASATSGRTHRPLRHVNSHSNPDGLLSHAESRPSGRSPCLAVLVHKAHLGFSQLFAFHLSLMTQRGWNLLHTLLHWTVRNTSPFPRLKARPPTSCPYHSLTKNVTEEPLTGVCI